jgi:hypothetical protein
VQHPISEKGSGTYLYASHMWGSGYAWTCILFPTAERVRRYEGNGFEGMKRVVRPQPVMQEWTQEALLRRFGLPADWVPATPADLEAFEARCVDLLCDPANKSGFKEVYPCKGKKPWQAKVYVGPKKQRQLGRFNTPLEAAMAIVWWRTSGDKLMSPKKDRNKRGEGRRKRDRRKGVCRLPSPFTPVLTCCGDYLLTDPSLPRKTSAVSKKTRRRVVLPPGGVLNAHRYETGLTAQVDGRDHPIVHVTCVLAASIDNSVVSVEPVAYLGA